MRKPCGALRISSEELLGSSLGFFKNDSMGLFAEHLKAWNAHARFFRVGWGRVRQRHLRAPAHLHRFGFDLQPARDHELVPPPFPQPAALGGAPACTAVAQSKSQDRVGSSTATTAAARRHQRSRDNGVATCQASGTAECYRARHDDGSSGCRGALPAVQHGTSRTVSLTFATHQYGFRQSPPLR